MFMKIIYRSSITSLLALREDALIDVQVNNVQLERRWVNTTEVLPHGGGGGQIKCINSSTIGHYDLLAWQVQ